jgi:hypothetical protein
MSINGKSISKLNDAMDAMRRPDARLIQTFSYYGKPDYWIAPSGGRVEQKIAEQIIAHPQVRGGKDALFPGHHQTWRMCSLNEMSDQSHSKEAAN